jgi:hypothetical protein
MKPNVIVLLVLMFFGVGLQAQQDRSQRFQKAMEEMQAERVSFLTTRLELTVDEAQKFWPVYNEYLKKREEMMWGRRERFNRDSNPEQASDEEMKRILNEMLDQEIKLAQLKKEYYTKIQELLPVRKVMRLQRAEQDFMNHMLNQIRGGKPGPDDRREGASKEPSKNPQGGGF